MIDIMLAKQHLKIDEDDDSQNYLVGGYPDTPNGL